MAGSTDRQIGIGNLSELEAVIGKVPPAIHLKVIDHLDSHALRWLAASPLLFAAFGNEGSMSVTLAGGDTGFAAADKVQLRLPLDALDDPDVARPGAAFGSLALVPGIGETLRVNGHVADVRDGEARIEVRECYLHCAKALIRSGFWTADPQPSAPDTDFVDDSRFMALATMNADGEADLSPKGDPAGTMAHRQGNDLVFADRPGNKKVDSFRNILAQPNVAAVLMKPGSTRVAIVSGQAALTTDPDIRAGFAVQGKVPLLATRVRNATVALHDSPALARARLWPPAEKAEGLNPATIFVDHLRINRSKSLTARVAGAVVSIPGMMESGLKRDYKTRLY